MTNILKDIFIIPTADIRKKLHVALKKMLTMLLKSCKVCIPGAAFRVPFGLIRVNIRNFNLIKFLLEFNSKSLGHQIRSPRKV